MRISALIAKFLELASRLVMGKIVSKQRITDLTGKNELVLYMRTRYHRSYNVDSIVWRCSNGDTWNQIKKITRAEFDNDPQYRRWISQLHSINPNEGTAVIQVAEGDSPRGSSTVTYVYSWRKWDLMKNTEIERLQACKHPFEAYDDGSS